MSEANPDFKVPGIGDFVKCFFPSDKEPGEPSRTSRCAMIVGISFDDELKVPLFTLVHASRELESDLMTQSSFTPLAREISGRVRVSETTDRIISPDRVAVLPVCARFFVDLVRHSHVKVLATATPDTVEKIRTRLHTPNMVALSVFRMEEQLDEHGVRPTLLIDRQQTIQASGGKLDLD